MKKLLNLIYFSLIVSVSIVGCRTTEKIEMRSCESNYPCLYLDIISISNWQKSDSFDAFIFNPFDSDTTNAWSLVIYGQDLKTSSTIDTLSNKDSLIYQVNPQILSTYNDTIGGYIPIDSTNMVFGNLSLTDEAFKTIVKTDSANCIYFSPRIDTATFRHLTYRIGPGIIDSTGHIKALPYGNSTQAYINRYKDTKWAKSHNIYKAADGSDEIVLNPCPPAHMGIE